MNRQLTILNFRLLLFTVFFLAAFVRLGFWQLERAQEKEAQRNAQAVAAGGQPVTGNFADPRQLHPRRVTEGDGPLRQLFGDLWEWTCSGYDAYPGFAPLPGALGEYNGKFMCNQYVLRGGSCATPPGHVRRTYRNFFPPDARWQFTGLRLARGV